MQSRFVDLILEGQLENDPSFYLHSWGKYFQSSRDTFQQEPVLLLVTLYYG